MSDNHNDIKQLYKRLGISDQPNKKRIRNTINTGNIYNNKKKVGIATASSAKVQAANK